MTFPAPGVRRAARAGRGDSRQCGKPGGGRRGRGVGLRDGPQTTSPLSPITQRPNRIWRRTRRCRRCWASNHSTSVITRRPRRLRRRGGNSGGRQPILAGRHSPTARWRVGVYVRGARQGGRSSGTRVVGAGVCRHSVITRRTKPAGQRRTICPATLTTPDTSGSTK